MDHRGLGARICRWVDGNDESPGRRGSICRNLGETAQALGVSPQTVTNWMRRGENPLPHVRDGRRILIPDAILDRWIEDEAARNAAGNAAGNAARNKEGSRALQGSQ